MVAVDQSGSVGRSNFDMVRKGLVEMVEAFYFNGEHNAKIGGVKFATGAVKLFEGLSSDKADVVRKISEMSYKGGWTHTHSGLAMAKKELEDHGRKGVAKVIVVVTDGECKKGSRNYCDQDVQETAAQIRTDGVVIGGERHPVTIISVGLGKAVNSPELTEQLRKMASDEKDVLLAEHFEDFNSIAPKIVNLACKETMTTSVVGGNGSRDRRLRGSSSSTSSSRVLFGGRNDGDGGYSLPQ